MKNIIITALIGSVMLGHALLNPAEPEIQPTAEIVQVVTAEGEGPDLTRDEIGVVLTAQEIIAEAEDTPMEPISPESEIQEPVTVDAEIETSAIGPFYDLAPCENDEATGPDCYWDASERGNGQGTDFIWFNGRVFQP